MLKQRETKLNRSKTKPSDRKEVARSSCIELFLSWCHRNPQHSTACTLLHSSVMANCEYGQYIIQIQVEPARGGWQKLPAARNVIQDWKTSYAYRSWGETSHLLNSAPWIRPHLASPLFDSSQFFSEPFWTTLLFYIISSHLSSPLLTSSQLSSALPTSSQLFSTRLSSSHLLPPRLSSSHVFSPLLNSSHLFSAYLNSCHLLSTLLNSSHLFQPLFTDALR